VIKWLRTKLQAYCHAQSASWRQTRGHALAAAFTAVLRGDVERQAEFERSAADCEAAIERWERRAQRVGP
jgi:hypothetical protein